MQNVLTSMLSFLLLAAVAGPVGVRAAPSLVRPPAALDVPAALALYDRGSYAEFFDHLDHADDLRDLFPAFAKQAESWIKSREALTPGRGRLVAATVALEIAHRLSNGPPEHAATYLLWASRLMRDPQPDAAAPAVKLWYLAAMAGMEELDDPWALTTATNPAQLDLQHLRRELEPGGHVAVALRLFPDEPRFRLAQIEAAEWRIEFKFLMPDVLESVRARARERAPSSPQSPDERSASASKYLAERFLAELDKLPGVEQEYQRLEASGSLRAEIELHAGYIESALMHWSNALDHLRLVPAYTTERFLQYLSEYFIGRTFQNMGEHASARGAFENAAAMIPGARAASTQLAAELLLTDNPSDRERAYSLLLTANSDSAPPDPWQDFRKGDARLWPVYMARLREALR